MRLHNNTLNKYQVNFPYRYIGNRKAPIIRPDLN
jgi:hypothetical protein